MNAKAALNVKARPLRQWMAGLFHSQPPAPAYGSAFNQTKARYLAARLEIADSAYARRKGLLGRDGLPRDAGLWIYPCESVHTFAMRFSIDLVYLDRNHVVRKVRSHTPPGRVSACLRAHSIIELPAGTVIATGTEAGDRIRIEREDRSQC